MKAYIFKGKSKKAVWWKNFIAGCTKTNDIADQSLIANKILKDQYNACVKYDFSTAKKDGWHSAYIEFTDEKEYTRFMLKWL